MLLVLILKILKKTFCFTSYGVYYLFSINYQQKVINKIYETNMKELKVASS